MTMKQSVELMNSMKLMNSRHSNKTTATTGLARRVLLLFSILSMGVGNVWGQTFNTAGTMVSGAIEKDEYLNVLSLRETNINIQSKESEIIAALNSFGSSYTSSDIADNVYIRWSILDGTNSVITNFAQNSTNQWGTDTNIGMSCSGGDIKWSSDISGFYWFKELEPWTNPHSLNTKLSVSVGVHNSKTFADFSDYTIVCYITDDLTGTTIAPNNYTAGSLNTEPNFKVKYTFHFGVKVDTFVGHLKSGSPLSGGKVIGQADVLSTSDVSATLDLTAALAEVSGAKYARFYLIKDGAAVDPTGKLTVTGGTAGPELEHGFYISNPAGLTASDLSGISLTLGAGEFEDYQVGCVFSTDDATSLLPAKEPDWDLQYTYIFEYPFKGDASSAEKVEKTFKQTGTQWTTSPKEFSIDFDFTNSKILLKDKDNSATLASVDFDKTWWDTNYPGASVSGKNFYIRWFLKSKSTGAEYYIANSIQDVKDATTYKNCAKAQYGRFWSKKIDDGQTDLSNIMRIKIDGTPDSPGADFDVRDYDLVCTIGTDGTETLDGSKQVTMEPATLQMQYTFHFEEPEFPADNINTVKTIYKTALYDKTTGKITPVLFGETGYLTDCEVSLSAFQSNSYARWYVVEKSTGKIVSDLSDWGFAIPTTADNPNYSNTAQYYSKPGFGWYATPVERYGATDGRFDLKITLPSGYDLATDYKNYDVVCVVSTNTSDMISETVAWVTTVFHEPTLKVKYVFNLMASDELDALPFVHYKGQSGRDWIVPAGSTGSQAQKIWNNSTGEAEDFTGDIRQGVHTWEYDVYVKPGEGRLLVLPLQDFTKENGDDALEPRGYFRWYDWKTDGAVAVDGSYTFAAADATNTKLHDIGGRGLFALSLPASVHPNSQNVGVTFTPTAAFSKTIDIACDVSKYSDGITTISGTSYLIHEPTLSNRYIFHIHPASEMAESLAASKSTLETAENAIKTGGANNAAMHDLFVEKENSMFKLMEDKGKVVVSLGTGKTGSFALRLDEHSLNNYILNTGTAETPNYVSANKVKWYAYFENDNGIWVKQISNEETTRITTFSFSNFTGDYTNLKGETGPTISDGKKFHVVGYVGNDSFYPLTGTGNYAPAVHYELHFIEAPATPIASIPLERTDEYLSYHYDLAGIVDFDGNPATNANISGHEAEYYSTANWSDAPTSSSDNMTYVPFPWSDIEYGFCYPQLTSTIKNGYTTGLYVSPEHGDYIILKSMNVAGISDDNSDVTAPHKYDWWNTSTLYDYTHTVTDNAKYGSFLYTDASDESRTIATIPFTADLCHGSSIYFTAAVADMTSGNTKPELLIRIVGIDSQGNRQRVVAFHTCDILTTGGETGKWNQIYGVSTIPNTFNDDITDFVAEVINYAKNTDGADFALDQLVIYTSTSKVLTKQTGSTCENPTAGTLKIYMDAEGLQNVYGKSDTEKTIYWRICREDDGTVVTGAGMYPQYDGAGNKLTDDGSFTYGVSKVKSNFNPTSDVKAETARESDNYGWYMASDNTIYFQIAYQNFPALEEGVRYYVSIYDPTQSFDASKDSFWGGLHWGATSKCSVFSNFFISQRQYVTYDTGDGSSEGGNISIACGGAATVTGLQMLLKVPDATEATGFKTLNDLHYDYVYVPMATWNSTTETFTHDETTYSYSDLKTAVADYRGASSTYKTTVGLDAGYSSSTHYAILAAAINEGILELAYSKTFTHTFADLSSSTVTCLPVEQKVTVTNTDDTGVCSPFEVTFHLKGSSPELALGFADVTYPTTGYTKRVVRIGLEQLDNLRTNGYKLHIPVNSFKDKDKTKLNALNFTSQYLTLSATSTDGVNTTIGTNFAKIVNPDNNSLLPYVDSDHMYLELDFSGANCAITTFYEGFEYEVSTSYYDSRDYDNPTGRCNGDIYLLFKVVPEFVTWDPQVISGDTYNVNWNNDANWKRSTRSELYKDENVSGKTQNSATYAHPSGYDNNGEHTLSSITTTPNTYIPMRFSYVTLPANCRAPSLVSMTITAYSGSDYTGGTIQAGNMATDTSPVGGTSDATTNLRYDMLVRYSYDSSDNQDKCQGHLKSDGTTVVGHGAAKIYDCEKYFGNTCREIYFKPGAELIMQQRLTYQKAWVEKELAPNTWTLLSNPLRATYAGDMYVPATAMADYSQATPSNVVGRQVTEAFQPIRMTDTSGNLLSPYSRTQYPIYQRSWGEDSKVYASSQDNVTIRKNYYDAGLTYSTATEATMAEWGHTFNDVQVDYTGKTAFAIRAHRKTKAASGTDLPNALIRLPKYDTSYAYYNYNGTEESPAAGNGVKTVTKAMGTTSSDYSDYAQLLVDFHTDALESGDLKTTNAEKSFALSSLQKVGDYYLVGNPYMASIDMAKFFDVNTGLATGYWTYSGSATMVSTNTGKIMPLQGFFVKKSGEISAIKFTRQMMLDGNAPVSNNPNGARGIDIRSLTLTAMNGNVSSSASVELSEKASADYVGSEDVETLFDSNLSDVPMVFTVAGSQAVSIDVRPSLDIVPFGVSCSSSDELVDVTLSGIAIAEGQLYVVDAVTGETREVSEGSTFSVQPNDYGRYFLTTRGDLTAISDATAKGIVVSVRNRQLTVRAAAPLQSVRILTVGGEAVAAAVDMGTEASFNLNGAGIYVVEAQTADSKKTAKVVVK